MPRQVKKNVKKKVLLKKIISKKPIKRAIRTIIPKQKSTEQLLVENFVSLQKVMVNLFTQTVKQITTNDIRYFTMVMHSCNCLDHIQLNIILSTTQHSPLGGVAYQWVRLKGLRSTCSPQLRHRNQFNVAPTDCLPSP